jgi:hypothetical protein
MEMQHAQDNAHPGQNIRHAMSAQSSREEQKKIRSRFEMTLKNLPKIKGNPRAPPTESKVAAWLDSTYSKSTKCNSVTIAETSKDGSSYPAYFYQHPENLFNPMKQDRKTAYIARAFHMTAPDERIKQSMFA